MDSEMTELQRMAMLLVTTAKSRDRLHCIADVFAEDKKENAEYLRDEAFRQSLRKAWSAKFNSLPFGSEMFERPE